MLLFILACKAPTPTPVDTATPPATCPVGSEDCPCTSGGSCDGDLECIQDTCQIPACPVATDGCPCTDGGTCDGALVCLATDLCGPEPVCGNGTEEEGESCDDGNQETEACAYGETACTVCDADCNEVAGATSYCGDNATDTVNNEACDEPNAPSSCQYGLLTCELCDDDCTTYSGPVSYCGDGLVDTLNEHCDGEAYCESTSCAFIGDLYENNDSVSNAVTLPLDGSSTFSHPLDMVHGPGFDSATFLFESPDVFEIQDVCNGGQLNVQLDFDASIAPLQIWVGRRPQTGGPSGPPPVLYEWNIDTIGLDTLNLTVDAPPVGSLIRDHYIQISVPDFATVYSFNAYTLSGNVTCP